MQTVLPVVAEFSFSDRNRHNSVDIVPESDSTVHSVRLTANDKPLTHYA
jgi:hypothetical protein